ncbi:MAG: Uma2 family endonuclease [Hyphomicrobiaceae bacterium]
MNETFIPASKRLPTQAADGFPRRRWTVAELEKMIAAGILQEDERIELVGGEVVAMSPKGRRHEVLRTELLVYWARVLPADLKIASETPLRLGDDTEPEPDLIVYPSTLLAPDLAAATVLLVVEVADSSLIYDLRAKAPIYAASGVPEYWVINANTLTTRVHRDPRPEGYASQTEVSAGGRLVPLLAPGLAVRLDELRIV